MLHLIEWLVPPMAHRLALRLGYRLRKRFRQLVRVPIAGVSVIVQDDAGRVLLARHSYGPDAWAMLGGGMAKGEEPQAAARREIREELGCELEALVLLQERQEQLSGSPHTAYIFTARPVSEPRCDRREIVKVRWFSREELQQLRMTRLTRERLVLAGLL